MRKASCAAFLRKVLRLSIRKEEGKTEWVGAVEYSFCKMDSHCQRGLASLRRFVGWCVGWQLLPSLLLTLMRGPDFFFEMTLASLKN
jgi:hypothetical protein